jgi:hypothetical protein
LKPQSRGAGLTQFQQHKHEMKITTGQILHDNWPAITSRQFSKYATQERFVAG